MNKTVDTLQFSKYHGAGNDFVIVDARHREYQTLRDLVPKLCHRNFGIGADGVMFLLPSTRAEYRVVYFNADGSQSVCGNGTRCVASYIFRNGFLSSKNFTLETDERIVAVDVIGSGDRIRVDMGAPIFDGRRIPTTAVEEQIAVGLRVGERLVTLTAVSMGNPHAVIFVERLDDPSLMTLGAMIEQHPFFPERANVEFVKVLSPDEVQMRVWERGVGETLACGTGNCAVLAAGVREGRLSRQIRLHAPGGEFEVSWNRDTDRISLTGPAEQVFEGECDLRVLR